MGLGSPLAAAVKLAIVPSHTVVSPGFVLTAGAVLTVNVAAVVVAVLHELANTARYLLPSCDAFVVKESVAEVAPGMSLKLEPPSVLTCH